MEMSPPKSCAVCGDKALGYNFNAVTCESCKAFFRRNALAKKSFTCPFSQNCEITVVTRRFCQRCRLKKCLDIGMKSENIMSEEDKLIKRRKIENNRAKKRLVDHKHDNIADSTGFDTPSPDSQSSFDSGKGTTSNTSRPSLETDLVSSTAYNTPITSTVLLESVSETKPKKIMTSEEVVEFIVGDPDRASQAISNLMRTKDEALSILENILTSQKDALRLVSHLIEFPGDALKIISKIMNSPFDALTVFTKFMSSPTDALEIIAKIVSSPQDVVQFIRNLMECPEDALDIMNKFMNTPAEALRIINKIFTTLQPPARSDELHQLLLDATKDKNISIPVDSTLSDCPKHVAKQGPSNQPPISKSQKTSEVGLCCHNNNNNVLFHSPETLPQMKLPVTQVEQGSTYQMLNKTSDMEPELPDHLSPPNKLSISVRPDMITDSPPPMNLQSMPIRTDTCESPSTNKSQSMQITISSSQSMSVTSPPGSVSMQDMQYNSPTIIQADIELPSISTELISPIPPTGIATDNADLSNTPFDIKSFMQHSFTENAIGVDCLNSLESVLSEVIRIEFQAFNNLPPETRVKQEQFQYQSNTLVTENSQQEHRICNTQLHQPLCTPSMAIIGRDLNEAEQMKLRELKSASEALYYPMDNDLSILMMGDDRIKPENTHQDPKLLQVINLTAVAIKRLIKMAKKIGVFRDMCQEDQVALLKGGCTEMMIMRSVLTYDNNRNTWKIPHINDAAHIRAEILKEAEGNIYEEILKFVSTFDEKCRMDENIILIMCAIVLFTPTRPRIIHSDVIRLEQNSYYYLLRRYLESVYPGCEAKSAFIRLIQKISDVERLNQFVIGVYLNVNPSQVEPLLREIFDLKNY